MGKSTQDRKSEKKAELRKRKGVREAQKMFEAMSDEDRADFQKTLEDSMNEAATAYNDFLRAAEGNMFLMALAKDPDFTKFCADNYTLGIHSDSGAKSIIKIGSEETLIKYIADSVPDEKTGSLVFTITQLTTD